MPYKLSEDAYEDLIRIYTYGLKEYGEKQADLYLSELYACFDLICEFPEASETVDHIRKGYRRRVCGKESIYYRIEKSEVQIMTIIGRQLL